MSNSKEHNGDMSKGATALISGQLEAALRSIGGHAAEHASARADLLRNLIALQEYARPVVAFLRAGEADPVDIEQLGAHATLVVVTAKVLHDLLSHDMERRS